ncbi:metallophosphoesterase [Thalassoroseus pseudoceratinae]|uniref:metallophosphoesterase n=1 Tax=Thalassoroseus pseudoceratinae TaxID=2713176 RepID=UPI00142330E6|nr:metallophosphoesterase [Thalassoroseus pseudoceratinae]
MSRSLIWILVAAVSFELSASAEDQPQTFGVWATSCSHVPADIKRGRESLGDAIRQSEGEDGFQWDIMIDAGDLSASQFPPSDEDGEELQIQYRALKNHRREQIYNVPGNHDAPYYDRGPGSWFRKWGDPLGENTEFSGVDPKRRPFPVEGTWERYRFRAGNLLVLMLADRNDAPTPVGRGHSSEKMKGGYPPGAVTRETFEWWKKQVLENQDKLIITMHHHALRDTTTGSGNGEGHPRYHGASGGAAGSSYLYFIIENDDPENFQYTSDAHVFEDFLSEFHKKHGHGAIDFWIGGHTHMKGPTDNFGNKTITETKWGVHFLQAAALTKYHAGGNPMSRLLTFTEDSDKVLVRTWLHDTSFRKNPVGFFEPATRTLKLRHHFSTPPPIQTKEPFSAAVRVFERNAKARARNKKQTDN